MAGLRGPLLAANAAFLAQRLFVYFWRLMGTRSLNAP
jgi:hypothetical protein